MGSRANKGWELLVYNAIIIKSKCYNSSLYYEAENCSHAQVMTVAVLYFHKLTRDGEN